MAQVADQFGVFVVRDGAWSLWATYPGQQNARDERDYLVGSLGLTAQVFRKVA